MIALHLLTLHVISVLHMIVILISEKNISLKCRCCFYYIRDLRRIPQYIFLSVVKTIVTAPIASKLDYCNSLLYNIASKGILKLQCLQNCLSTARFSHSVTPTKSLHLPVQSRIIFKLWTFISVFHDYTNTQAQRTSFIWFRLVVCSQELTLMLGLVPF